MPWRADGGAGSPPRDGGAATCERVRGWIDPHLDGDLERPRAEALEAHLRGCPDCRSELALARRLREALREGLPMLACPPEVTEEVLRIAREEAARRPAQAAPGRRRARGARGLGARWVAWLTGGGALRPVLAAAALVLLVLAAPLLYRALAPAGPGSPEETAAGPREAPYTDAEVARAEEQARLVLAYVASVGRDAGRAVQDEVFDPGIVRPARRVVAGLQAAGAAPGASAGTGRRVPPAERTAERNQP